MIGIVSGAGPLAGLDVARKIIEETLANTDQEHLPVLIFSLPEEIPDRTEFLTGKVQDNPGIPLSDLFIRLEKAGATVAAVACNTAHAAPIFDVVLEKLNARSSQIQVLHLIQETVREIKDTLDPSVRIGILATNGSRQQQLYSKPLNAAGFHVLEPDPEFQQLVNAVIYHPVYGIKAQSSPVHPRAVEDLHQVMDMLIEQGAGAILLGCTELPLAVAEQQYRGVPVIDPNRLLARFLIRAYAPEKLK